MSSITLSIPGVQDLYFLPSGGPFPTLVVVENKVESRNNVKRHKPPGWIPPTNYSLNSVHRRGSLGTYGIKDKFGNGFLYKGAVAGSSGSSWTVDYVTNFAAVDISGEIASIQNTALTQARNNLKQMKVDLGTAFGERNQTARMIGDTAKRMADAVRALRRGQIRDAMRHLQLSAARGVPRGSNWTNNWLQLQYGWKPMLSDIFGACDALAKRDKDNWMVTAKGHGETSLTGSFSNRVAGSHWFVASSQYELKAFTRVDAYLSEISSLVSLGVTNPLNVAWELMPYSFVVDWILPIGDWINSLDATLGLDIRGVSSTTFQRWQFFGNGESHTEDTGTTFTNDWQVYKRVVLMDRTASTVLPFASFPSLKDPRSLGHMANGLSLLAQAFGR